MTLLDRFYDWEIISFFDYNSRRLHQIHTAGITVTEFNIRYNTFSLQSQIA